MSHLGVIATVSSASIDNPTSVLVYSNDSEPVLCPHVCLLMMSATTAHESTMDTRQDQSHLTLNPAVSASPLVNSTILWTETLSTISFFSPESDRFRGEIVVGILSSLLAVIILFGNTLVILAVYRERQLRTVTNFYIVSLACADFMIGIIVLPFSIYMEVTGGYWPFGDMWCDLWHAFDIQSCTASILNLCVIACDRYWAITRPISYPTRMTKRTAAILIGAVWICSALISFPCIWWWRAVEPPHPPSGCIFPSNTVYLITSSCISFYVPSVIMVFMYLKIYRTAVGQVKALRAGTKHIRSTNGNGVAMRVHRGGTIRTVDGAVQRRANSVDGHLPPEVSPSHAAKRRSSLPGKKFMSRLSREHKAARTLGIVMGIFIICWLPFFIVNVTTPVCTSCHFHPIILGTVTWLGYVNSALNPIIYAFASRRFKHAFTRILCSCRKEKSRSVSERARSGSIAPSSLLCIGSPANTSVSSLFSEDIASANSSSSVPSNNRYSLPYIYF